MLCTEPTTCRHGYPVTHLEIISLDLIGEGNPHGTVDLAVPVEHREAVMARCASLTAAHPTGGYRVQQVHGDACKTLVSAAPAPSTPREMFAHARTAR